MKAAWSEGNRVELLENGDGFFPEVFGAIRAARDEVLIETFILFEDEVGRALHEVLVGAARRGVHVDLTVDDWGSPDLSDAFVRTLSDAGVRVRAFSPRPRLFGLRTNVMRRLHRKLVVVDGTVAFVGGINFSADHLRGYGPQAKTDYAVRLDGPIAGTIRDFALRAIGVRDARRWWGGAPPAAAATPAGTARIRFVTRDNRDHPRDIERQYRVAIRAAQRDVVIANAYFFPGYLLLRELRRAARRGVRVRLLLQGRPDTTIVTVAAWLLYGHLASAGIGILEYCERPFHGKVAVVDEAWATVGSSNLEPLSLTMNLEANVVIVDRAFNARLRASLERLVDHCRAVEPQRIARHGPWGAFVTGLVLAALRRLPHWVARLPAHRTVVAPHPGLAPDRADDGLGR